MYYKYGVLKMNEEHKYKEATSVFITTIVFIVATPFAVTAAIVANNQYGIMYALPFTTIAIICFIGVLIGIYLNTNCLRK